MVKAEKYRENVTRNRTDRYPGFLHSSGCGEACREGIAHPKPR